MPSTGTSSSRSSRRSLGAPSAYTDAGPPERIRAFGRRRVTSSSGTWCGRSSLKTPHSRTRRAISCEYWPPKSRTRTSSVAEALPASTPGREVAAACAIRLLADERRVSRRRGLLAGPVAAHHAVRRRRCLGGGDGAHADRLVSLKLLALGLE